MIRRTVIKYLAALLALGSSAVAALRGRAVLWPWMTESMKLFAGTLAYNAFALFFVQPLLRRWFPPLKPWEHVSGLFGGGTRTTYEQIVPVVATTLWILGNALLVVMMNRRLRSTREAIAVGGAMASLEARPRPGR